MLRPLAMHRLFSNLVDNAVMYAHRVRVRVERSGGTITAMVSDDGPGLAEDQLEAVFDPFVRVETSRSRETGGAGLGLTIARALAEGWRAAMAAQPCRGRSGGGGAVAGQCAGGAAWPARLSPAGRTR